eukprot:TRINITY_DN10309_c0_g1_i1.p3 TRINITY_DN10309_c0_g1~~TRINITY_DN10309_c0_g1_i1.p3  ORF type:complete len:106 (+),score=5.91 TRINITY_DN10309_c0_g1_i1:248-565(+)
MASHVGRVQGGEPCPVGGVPPGFPRAAPDDFWGYRETDRALFYKHHRSYAASWEAHTRKSSVFFAEFRRQMEPHPLGVRVATHKARMLVYQHRLADLADDLENTT